MSAVREIVIAGRPIGAGHPPYVIAELSANHLQDFDRAMRILEASAAAGADAVKLQTYRPDTLTLDADGPQFRIEGGLWDGKRLYDLYDDAYMPWEWHAPLMKRGRELGVHVFSSPFDETAIDLLESLDVPAFKIASFEVVDLPLIRRAARSGKPLIVSTGMANEAEIAAALDAAGGRNAMLLHCVSGYPTPVQEANLGRIAALREAFGVPVGLSDHTMGTVVAVAAVALGACVIEKHITLQRADGGPDAAFSLEPHELETLCRDVRAAFDALQPQASQRARSEEGNVLFRRSLYVVADIAAGETFTPANVRSIRPGHGLAPKHYDDVIGRTALRALRRGEPLTRDAVKDFGA